MKDLRTKIAALLTAGLLLGTTPVMAAGEGANEPEPYGPVRIYTPVLDGDIFNPLGNGDGYGPVTKGFYGRNACYSPRAVQLEHQPNPADNGKMLITFEMSPQEKRSPFFPIYESVDNGESWAYITELEDTHNAYNAHGIEKYIKPEKEGDYWGLMNCPDLFELPVQMGDYPAGTIICAGISTPYDQDYRASWTTDPSIQHTIETDPDGFLAQSYLELYASKDMGRTWEYVSTIDKGGMNNMICRNEYGGALWEPHLFYNEESGNLICYYSDESDVNHSQKLVLKTTNDLASWGNYTDVVAIPGYNNRPGMAVVTKTAADPSKNIPSRYALVYETANAPFGMKTAIKFSDDPENWKDVDQWGEITTKGSGSSPYITTLSDGRLVYGSSASSQVFVNTELDGSGEWVGYATPLVSAHNRQFFQLADGRLFISRGQGWGGGAAAVECGAIWIEEFPNLSGSLHFLSKKSGGAIAINDASMAEGKDLIEWAYGSNDFDHQWTIEPAEEEGYVKITSKYSGLSVGSLNHSSAAGTVPAQYTYSIEHDDMQWKIEQMGGYFTLVNKHGLYLSRAEHWFASGYRLRMTEYDESDIDSHLWSILPHQSDDYALEITSLPDKTQYGIGEGFDSSGLAVAFRVSDEELLPVQYYLLSGFESETAGEKTVTVTYGDKTVSFTVLVSSGVEPIDKAELIALIIEAEGYSEPDYTPQSWEVFEMALEAAIDVRDDDNTSQEAVNQAVQKLRSAMNELVPAEEEFIEVESISILNGSLVTVQQGRTVQLEVGINPSDATDKTLTYQSSNEGIANVSEDGLVTAKSNGFATITITAHNGCKATIMIRVS